MHVVGNVMHDMRDLFRGQRTCASAKVHEIVAFEQEENNRFMEWRAGDPETAPFVIPTKFLPVIQERLRAANLCAGPSWGSATKWHRAFDAPTKSGASIPLDKADWWLFTGPVAAWAMCGAWRHAPFEDAAFSMVKALDGLKGKVTCMCACTC